MFNEKMIPYTSAISSMKVDYAKKAKLVAIAVAAAVAYSLPMATTDVGDVSGYFRGNHANNARSMVLSFNDAAVLDKQLA